MDPDDVAYVGTEVLNNIEMSGMPEHQLRKNWCNHHCNLKSTCSHERWQWYKIH